MEDHNVVQEAVHKIILKKQKSKKAKSLFEEAKERRETESKGERERYIQLNADFQRTSQRDKKAFSMNSV